MTSFVTHLPPHLQTNQAPRADLPQQRLLFLFPSAPEMAAGVRTWEHAVDKSDAQFLLSFPLSVFVKALALSVRANAFLPCCGQELGESRALLALQRALTAAETGRLRWARAEYSPRLSVFRRQVFSRENDSYCGRSVRLGFVIPRVFPLWKAGRSQRASYRYNIHTDVKKDLQVLLGKFYLLCWITGTPCSYFITKCVAMV